MGALGLGAGTGRESCAYGALEGDSYDGLLCRFVILCLLSSGFHFFDPPLSPGR